MRKALSEEEEEKEEEEKAMLADPCRNHWVLGRCPVVRGTEWVPEQPTSTGSVVVTLTKCGLFPHSKVVELQMKSWSACSNFSL